MLEDWCPRKKVRVWTRRGAERRQCEAAWENNAYEGGAEIAVMHAKARQEFPAVNRGYERGPEEIFPGSPQKERTLPTPEAARGREVPPHGCERDHGPAHLDLDFGTPALVGTFLSFCTTQYLVKPVPLTVTGLKTLTLGLWG